MRQTLFHIPNEIGGWPLFGFGIALAVMLVGAAVLLAITARKQGLGREFFGYLPVLALIAGAIIFVLPAISQGDGLPIRGFGVTLLLGVGSGVGITAWRAKRRGIDPDLIFTLAFWLFGAGLVGARLFYVIEYWPQFLKPTLRETLMAVIAVQEGGLVIYGCVLGGAAALIAFVYKHKLPGYALTDLVAPGLLVGLAFGRVGCFLNGCCFGGVCELPWAVQFPAGSPPYVRQAERGQLYGIQVSAQVDAASSGSQAVISSVTPNSEAAKQGVQVGDRIVTINEQPITSAQEAWQAIFEAFRLGESIDLETSRGQAILLAPLPGSRTHSLAVHPTQLYSVLDALLIAWFLVAFEPFRRRDGEATAITCTLYPITRFLIEIIRTDEAAVFGTGMSISQNISLAILVYATLLWMRLLRSPPKIAWPIGGTPAVTESKHPFSREVRVAGASAGQARPVDRPAKR